MVVATRRLCRRPDVVVRVEGMVMTVRTGRRQGTPSAVPEVRSKLGQRQRFARPRPGDKRCLDEASTFGNGSGHHHGWTAEREGNGVNISVMARYDASASYEMLKCAGSLRLLTWTPMHHDPLTKVRVRDRQFRKTPGAQQHLRQVPLRDTRAAR
jgi:hypothetical protein